MAHRLLRLLGRCHRHLKKAAIFVDGRYTIQVRSEVDTKLVTPQHLMDEPPTKWIAQNLKKGDRLGFDPWLVTIDQAKRFREACESIGAAFVALDDNPSMRSGRISRKGRRAPSSPSPRNSPAVRPQTS